MTRHGNYTAGVGFDPYKQIRRARMTKRGDLLFLISFFALMAGLIVWAAW